MDVWAQRSIHSAVGLKIGEVLIADCDPFLIIGREHPIKVQEGPLARIAAHRVVGIQMPQRLERPGGDEAAPREEVWQLLAIREEMVALVPAIIFQRLTGKRLGEAEHRRSQGNGYHQRDWKSVV